MEEKNIESVINIPMTWSVIDKKDYQKYHILSTVDVNAVCSWFASNENDRAIVTLYDYGNDKDLVAGIDESFKQIKKDEALQKQYNLIPVFFAKGKVGGKPIYFSAIKNFDFASVAVDVYFVYEGKNYALHTVVDSIEGNSLSGVITSSPRLRKICEIIQSI